MNHLPSMPPPSKVKLLMEEAEDLRGQANQAKYVMELHKAVCPHCRDRQVEEMIADFDCQAGRKVAIHYTNTQRSLRMRGE